MILTETELAQQKQRDITTLDPKQHHRVAATWYKRDDGLYQVLSTCDESVWEYPTSRFTLSTPENQRKCRFHTLSQCFEVDIKSLWRQYDIAQKSRGETLIKAFTSIKKFLEYLSEMQVTCLSQINTMHCANYVTHCRQLPGRKGNKLTSDTLTTRFRGVETLWEMCCETPHQFAPPGRIAQPVIWQAIPEKIKAQAQAKPGP